MSLLVAPAFRILVVDPESEDGTWCFEQYYKELGERLETGFDLGVTSPVRPQELRPPAGLLMVAYRGNEAVGCGALKFHNGVGEIKRLWVARSVRGQGLGRRLLETLEGQAKAHHCRALHLDTNRALTEAIALYRSSGYQEVEPFNKEPYAHHWFEKRL
ncbi:MAG TPA: GNAT family N-acetyltransferase, partial [Nitrososphaerales archaeon]|nr:GNAT family N-acetyltransferase [Nitrososphaerales archaeon]